MSGFPTPHLVKLTAARENEKLPACDQPRIEQAIHATTSGSRLSTP